ncbi:LLM class flavin-dependent oxidoreductase [Salicibibacter cibi]|uniref:LLM class flavin-dependent oxidoreductase n=1 Tax=Salicibibacter cibi TaxID=2743001 RepID=A0A7T7CH16_9BACI|nr:LLM class flavin-dependent oxidoreductase [Salicibibacter cibi]QQK81629.1 LLM class flavin-dependent oxidoreductase [Salicibibacter cibi]
MNAEFSLSVLDLAPVHATQTPADAFENSKKLIQHADKLGYHRYWVAEHHNMKAIASSATSVLIGYLAGHSENIRVGSGGVMLPNHAPLIIAEQFGTLEAMYPGRIDLGLGRAPGTDPMTIRALRRDQMSSVNDFPDNVNELLNYFSKEDAPVKAIPGHGLEVPIYLLGSSTYSAQLAAALGLPFAFASHFAPGELFNALRLYHERFQASKFLSEPYAMVTVNAALADTTQEAEKLATTNYLRFLSIVRGGQAEIDTKPVDNMDEHWTEFEKAQVLQSLKYSFVGDQEKVKKELEDFHAEAKFNELIVSSDIYDQEKRRRSYELLANIWNE